jgi:hypothetical protein
VSVRRHLLLRKFLLPTSGLLLVLSLLTIFTTLSRATPASAAPEITICLKYASSYCADVKNSYDVSGQTIWLYQPSAGAKDYHWYEYVVDCGLSNYCYEFVDVQNTSLCLGASSDQRAVLTSCGIQRSEWVVTGTTHLRNFFWAEDLTVQGPLYNGDPLFVYPKQPGGTNLWQQWTGQ